VARLRAEKKQIGAQHVRNQRTLIDRYILQDPVADKNLVELRRGDILDFRGRLLAKVSDARANRVIGCLKTCIKEAVYREELPKDPTLGVGNIHHEALQRGVFTADELRRLFPALGLGSWGSLQAFACFLVAATVGLRRGEVLALRWRDLDFDKLQLHVRQAWKSDTVLGPPKWGKVREELPLPELTARRLRELRGGSLHVLPDALVFHEADGSRKPALWWREAFTAAMVQAKIPAGARRLTAHSFRHSLNTLLRDGGVPAEKIRAVMGWTNEKTQDGYTHFHGEHLRGQADLIDKILG
jgi:integrase